MSHLRDGWDEEFSVDSTGSGDASGEERRATATGGTHNKDNENALDELNGEDVGNGWDDDSNLQFEDEEEYEDQDRTALEGNPRPSVSQQQPSAGGLYDELEAYVLSLEHLGASINSLLEAEYNNQDKAMELSSYYAERPGLVGYTIEKELPRMEYVLQDGRRVITDKTEIAKRLKHESSSSSLIPRCANQSLLADLLQVFTGRDLLIRPQFLATAIAYACNFYLDLIGGLVQVQSHLNLSLPSDHGERWEIAEIFVSLTFVPSQYFVEYKLDRIVLRSTPETDPMWGHHLRSVADIVSSIHPDDGMMGGEGIPSDDMNFRDAFLQQSQNLLVNSTEGMHSAWKDFEQVAGLRNKLSKLPGFLPDHVVHAAAAEVPISPPQQRPASILGGLVRSGISRLAKQVALPEEDTSLYEGWTQQPATTSGRTDKNTRFSGFPRPHDEPQPSTELRRTPHTVSSETPAAPALDTSARRPSTRSRAREPDRAERLDPVSPVTRKLYRDSPPPPGVTAHVDEFTLSAEQVVTDGWDDDDVDLDMGDDQEEVVPTTTTGPGEDYLSSRKEATVKFLVDEQRVPDDFVYDPTTDIIPTRQRWNNPHPGGRVLRFLK